MDLCHHFGVSEESLFLFKGLHALFLGALDSLDMHIRTSGQSVTGLNIHICSLKEANPG